MSVKEELATSRVPVAQSLGGVAEQRAGEAVESSTLRLEPLSAHVDDETLTGARRAPVISLAHVNRRLRPPSHLTRTK